MVKKSFFFSYHFSSAVMKNIHMQVKVWREIQEDLNLNLATKLHSAAEAAADFVLRGGA